MKHMEYLDVVRQMDVATLRSKEATYQGSWKAAGGRSAWFMARRNMDRLLNMMKPPAPPAIGFNPRNVEDLAENIAKAGFDDKKMVVEHHTTPHNYANMIKYLVQSYRSEDIFAKIEESPGGEDGTVLACVRDLRCYFTLIEAEMMARGAVTLPYANGGVVEKGPDVTAFEVMANHPHTHMRTVDGDRRPDTWPWIWTNDDWPPLGLTPEFMSRFYEKRGVNLMVLESHVRSHKIPSGLAPLYQLCSDRESWTIHIDKVPAAARSYYPVLVDGINLKEFDELESWKRELYRFDDSQQKYNLKKVAWADGASE